MKKITDQNTFSLIRDKISLRNANYFKTRFSKPIQNNDFSKNGKTEDLNLKFNNSFN